MVTVFGSGIARPSYLFAARLQFGCDFKHQKSPSKIEPVQVDSNAQ